MHVHVLSVWTLFLVQEAKELADHEIKSSPKWLSTNDLYIGHKNNVGVHVYSFRFVRYKTQFCTELVNLGARSLHVLCPE